MAKKLKKRTSLVRVNRNTSLERILIGVPTAVFLAKFVGMFFVYGFVQPRTHGVWGGSDAESYLQGMLDVRRDGIFTTSGSLVYFPAGYSLTLFLLSLVSASQIFYLITIFQSFIFGLATYYLTRQLQKTSLARFALAISLFLSLNPTLSLSSMVVGYESLVASGFILILGLFIKQIREEKLNDREIYFIAAVGGFISLLQPRYLLASAVLIFASLSNHERNRKLFVTAFISILILALSPLSLMARNQAANDSFVISTNLGITMQIGAGESASGGYVTAGSYGVKCPDSERGDAIAKDRSTVSCVLKWYLTNPKQALRLFANKTMYFWSPWYGPAYNGTMARNPWLKMDPLALLATDTSIKSIEFGVLGKIFSWLWESGQGFLLVFGFLALWKRDRSSRSIAFAAMSPVFLSWGISLMTIGDNRFRIPTMGLSLILQAVGLLTLFESRQKFQLPKRRAH